MTKRILILNGPNLNMLGTREPSVYGAATLGDIEILCQAHVKALSCLCDFRQSNVEGELVTWIQEAKGAADVIIINAGAYTHTSVAIRDALLAVEIPVIEVHISNIFKREVFRHHSYLSDIAHGVICGFGPQGYVLALDAAAAL